MSFGGGGKGPFDFDASRMPRVNVPNFIPKNVVGILAGLVIAVLLFMAVYQIQPDEQGVVLQFGRYHDTTDPGLHFVIPLVQEVIKVPVQRQLKQEFGFRTVSADVRSTYVTDDYHEESAMLTGDLNVAAVEWIVQYKIGDPQAFLFNVRDPVATFRDMTEAAVRQVVGDHSVDEVITTGRASIAAQAQEILQELCRTYEIGIDVQQLVLQDVNPPDPVKPSFNEVNEAIQEREQLTNLARTEYNQAIPKARGEAQQLIQEAEGYATARVNRAEGEATRFEAIYEEYRKAPRVTRNRMYLEMLNEVLPRVGKKFVMDENGANVLPLLNLAGGNNQ